MTSKKSESYILHVGVYQREPRPLLHDTHQQLKYNPQNNSYFNNNFAHIVLTGFKTQVYKM